MEWKELAIPIASGIIGGMVTLIGRWMRNHDQLVVLTTEMLELRANVARIEGKVDHIRGAR